MIPTVNTAQHDISLSYLQFTTYIEFVLLRYFKLVKSLLKQTAVLYLLRRRFRNFTGLLSFFVFLFFH